MKDEFAELKAALEEAELFITEVLAKCDLPADVAKQRKELSERLRKVLNKNGDASPGTKPALPERRKTPPQEVCDEFYDDVNAAIANQTEATETTNANGIEAKAEKKDVQETYDDVTTEVEEMYDDIATATGATADKVSHSSDEDNHKKTATTTSEGNKSVSNTEDIIGPKKASEIVDKIFEGHMGKYKKGKFKLTDFQRRYFILTPFALYYYANLKDSKQKGTIVLPSNDYVLRQGCPNHPEVKQVSDLCFELGNKERNYLFKAEKPADCAAWMDHIKAALNTQLSDEEFKLVRTQSMGAQQRQQQFEDGDEEFETVDDDNMYESVDRYNVAANKSGDSPSNTRAAAAPALDEEEIYEETEQFSVAEEPSVAKDVDVDGEYCPPDIIGRPPTLPSRGEKPPSSPLLPARPPSGSTQEPPAVASSPSLPPRPPVSPEAPQLVPRAGKSTQQASHNKTPPEIPNRTTPPLEKKATPEAVEELEVDDKHEVGEPEVNVSGPAVILNKPVIGEKFDYARVYVALYNCQADDDDDLAFERGNQLYIREKIPNSDWWVASLMDRPDVRVGLVPRNYLMAAYEL